MAEDSIKGEKDLQTLLSTMQPSLSPETYVFLTLPKPLALLLFSDAALLSSLAPQLLFEESEGTTIITTQERAAAQGFNADQRIFPSKKISLSVHSDLEAVGLTAAISTAFTEAGISANVVAAFYHDHVFVPEDRAEDAMEVLRLLMS